MPVLFLLFIILPIAEVMVFISVGGEIGVLNTLLVCLLTAFAGSALIRYQGLGVLNDIRGTMSNHQIPLNALFDGVCLLLAGAMLITPGFVTDSIGFALLIPAIRNQIRDTIRARIIMKSDNPESPSRWQVIEGEYERLD